MTGVAVPTRVFVPGHTSWPQNGPCDANLAHLVSCNTAFLSKDTTHKTPQSTELLAFWLCWPKSVSDSRTQTKVVRIWVTLARGPHKPHDRLRPRFPATER